MEKLKSFKRNIYILVLILISIWLIIDLNTRLSTLKFLRNQEATLQADVDNLHSTMTGSTMPDRIRPWKNGQDSRA